MSNEQAIVCDLTAIPAEMREQHIRDSPRIFRAAQEVRELADGYAFRFPNKAKMWLDLATFVEYDRLCCPFFRFSLTVESNHGPLWLAMTGPEGTKALLTMSLSAEEADGTFQRLIHTGGDARLDHAVAQAAAELTGVLP